MFKQRRPMRYKKEFEGFYLRQDALNSENHQVEDDVLTNLNKISKTYANKFYSRNKTTLFQTGYEVEDLESIAFYHAFQFHCKNDQNDLSHSGNMKNYVSQKLSLFVSRCRLKNRNITPSKEDGEGFELTKEDSPSFFNQEKRLIIQAKQKDINMKFKSLLRVNSSYIDSIITQFNLKKERLVFEDILQDAYKRRLLVDFNVSGLEFRKMVRLSVYKIASNSEKA
jgi:hypothetical protein